MGLTETQKKGLEELDISKSGGFNNFITNSKKEQTNENMFLFVGLGGKGGLTVAKLKTEAYKQLEVDDTLKRPNNFEYLVIDTDINALNILTKTGFGLLGLSNALSDNETCQLYDNDAKDGLKAENRKNLPPGVKEWLNPMANPELTGEGANGIRQAGRYLLFGTNAFSLVENALTAKITKLHNQIINHAKQKLIIYIFAGVGGGTGSGTIIDIPYIIRKICANKHWQCKINGYIFLADTYEVDAQIIGRLKYNSYAALKEIDYFMNIAAMDGTSRFKAEYRSDFKIDSTEKIFNTCVLVSGKAAGGNVPNPSNFSQRVVVDNIINLVKENKTSVGLLIDSFLDNSPVDIMNSVNQYEEIPKNANYQYNVIGIGSITLPLEQILNYVSYHTFKLLNSAWDKHATQQDVETLLKNMNMLPEEQISRIQSLSAVPLMRYFKEVGGKASRDDVKFDNLYNRIKNQWLNYNVKLSSEWDRSKNKVLEEILTKFDTAYSNMFTDGDKGIYYLRELLASNTKLGSFNGILERLKNDYLNVEGYIAAEMDTQNQAESEMRIIKEEMDSVLLRGPFLNKKIEHYRECCIARLVSDNMIMAYEIVSKNIIAVIKHIEEKLSEIQSYIDVFTYMQEIVDKNYVSVMEGSMPAVHYGTQLLDLSKGEDPNTEKVINYLNGLINTKRPDLLASNLADKIQRKENLWKASDDSFNPMVVFTEFLEDEFDDIPKLTIAKFITLKYGVDNVSEGISQICEQLQANAKVIFAYDGRFPISGFPSKKHIVIPSGDSQIGKEVGIFAKNKGAIVAVSDDPNNILWYNWICGIPLFALKDIAEYEEVYEKILGNISSSGIHLFENSGINWKDFPPLFTQDWWIDSKYNPREFYLSQQVMQDTQDFMENELLMLQGEDYYAKYFSNINIDQNSILHWCIENYLKDNSNKHDTGCFKTGSYLFEKMTAECEMCVTHLNIKCIESDLHKYIRKNWMLYKRLQNSNRLLNAAKDIVNLKNNMEM